MSGFRWKKESQNSEVRVFCLLPFPPEPAEPAELQSGEHGSLNVSWLDQVENNK
jgi:hypothetical protein